MVHVMLIVPDGAWFRMVHVTVTLMMSQADLVISTTLGKNMTDSHYKLTQSLLTLVRRADTRRWPSASRVSTMRSAVSPTTTTICRSTFSLGILNLLFRAPHHPHPLAAMGEKDKVAC